MRKTDSVTLTQILLLAAIAAITIFGLIEIPALTALPVHWNVRGEVDAYWQRNYALAVPPCVALATMLLNILVAHRRAAANGRHIARAAITASLIICLAIQSGIVMTAPDRNIDMPQIVTLAVALLLALVGNAMPKSRANAFAGLR